MTADVRDWHYASLPEEELTPSPRQQALSRLAQALELRDEQAAKSALLDLPQSTPHPPAIDPLILAAAEIAAAAQNDEEPPQSAMTAAAEWLATAEPLTGGIIIREPFTREWLVPSWIPAARAGLLAGAGGVGKTRIALQLAHAVATGEDWLCISRYGQSPAPVVYATYEDELQELGHRLNLIDPSPRPLPIYAYDLTESGSLWDFPNNSRNGVLPSAGAKLRRACERADAKLLIIDNLASAFGGNENDRAQVRSFVNAWDSWSRKTGCATLMIGHSPKNRGHAKNENGLTHMADIFSGSTDWLNAVRYAIALDAAVPADDSNYQIYLRFLKGNYAKTIEKPIPLTYDNGVWTTQTALFDKADAPLPQSAREIEEHQKISHTAQKNNAIEGSTPIPRSAI